MINTSNYQIIVYDCIMRKTVNKHILYNVTEEQANKNLQKAREYFTFVTGHFCDGSIKEIKNK